MGTCRAPYLAFCGDRGALPHSATRHALGRDPSFRMVESALCELFYFSLTLQTLITGSSLPRLPPFLPRWPLFVLSRDSYSSIWHLRTSSPPANGTSVHHSANLCSVVAHVGRRTDARAVGGRAFQRHHATEVDKPSYSDDDSQSYLRSLQPNRSDIAQATRNH